MTEPKEAARGWDELRDTGLLWLINRVVFHPRGYALALVVEAGAIVGWTLLGDGREPWRFDGDEDDLFERSQQLLRRRPAGIPGPPASEEENPSA